ncbi:MAG TPA: DoxX family protein [Candidatus Limnocylindrales bacterium]|jgi:thiosulfate dehydrogenase [quinone] large subunit|nr:DoxX family protein [Candidatus Limnocylindrales bacterium]
MTAIHRPNELQEPAVARFLFADTRAAWLWLVVRLYLGYEWLVAGWEKATDPTGVWVGAKAGAALTGFAQGALGKASGDHPQVQGWYASFLDQIVVPNAGLFAHLVTYGEILVGLGLIVGALTGIAAVFGIVMNANYLLAGTVSTNPILAFLAIFIVLAWRNAGWIGLDRWLLPLLGTPWQHGRLFEHPTETRTAATR